MAIFAWRGFAANVFFFPRRHREFAFHHGFRHQTSTQCKRVASRLGTFATFVVMPRTLLKRFHTSSFLVDCQQSKRFVPTVLAFFLIVSAFLSAATLSSFSAIISLWPKVGGQLLASAIIIMFEVGQLLSSTIIILL